MLSALFLSKMKIVKSVICLSLALGMACSSTAPVGTTPTAAKSAIDIKVDSVLKLMTLQEKGGQLNQYNGFYDVTGPEPKSGQAAEKLEHLKKGLVGSVLNITGAEQVRNIQKIVMDNSRLKIPLIFGFDVIHGFKTISPIPLAEAASWDLRTIEKSARMAAEEASAAGINWTFAPMVDVSRDARWGRVMEGSGEDPYLGSQIAVARIKGFQGTDLAANNTILACAKHFVGYGFAEAGRDYNSVDVSEATLENVLFPPFKASVDAGVRTFMNAFNDLNGVPATASSYLQRDVLKNRWNFSGAVVSDWGSIMEMIPHGYASNLSHAAEIALNAGNDIDMESYAYVNHLEDLVRSGKVSEENLNDAVRRVLKLKFELGLFDDPYKYCDAKREKEVTFSEPLQIIALDMALKSVVLLKNEQNLLPLPKSGKRIAVIGALAADKTSPLGSWRIGASDNTAVSLLEGLKNYPNAQITYAKGADVALGETKFVSELTINTTDKSGFAAAIETAKNADIVVMMLGEHGLQSGEGRSRSELGLPGVQQELLEAVFAVNKSIVLVLQNGRPLTIPWAAENIPAIVEAWHLGTQSGNAIAQILFGDFNPQGKLPMSFPRSVGQLPLYYNAKSTGRPAANEPNSVFWSHYGDVPNTPQFPFGYGLSYTTFSYNNLRLSSAKLTDSQKITASIDLTNTGKVSGTEVVQLYIQDEVATGTRPVKELKGFELVTLAAGETKSVTFTIDKKMLEFFSANRKWETEDGTFKIYIGTNAQTNSFKVLTVE